MGEKEIYAYRRAGGSQFLSSVWKLNGLRMIIGFLLMSLYGICQLVDEILVRHGWKRKPGSSSPQLILNEIVAGRIWQVQYGHNNSTIIKGKDGSLLLFQIPPRSPELLSLLPEGEVKYAMSPDSAHNKNIFEWHTSSQIVVSAENAEQLEAHKLLEPLKAIVYDGRDSKAFASIAENYFIVDRVASNHAVWSDYVHYLKLDAQLIALAPCPFYFHNDQALICPLVSNVVLLNPTQGPRTFVYAPHLYLKVDGAKAVWKSVMARQPDLVLFRHGNPMPKQFLSKCVITGSLLERQPNVV